MRARPSRTPFVCPICDEALPANAKSCPGCGACERSGWNQDARYDGLDLPDDPEELPFGPTPTKTWIEQFGWLVALVILIAMACLVFGRG